MMKGIFIEFAQPSPLDESAIFIKCGSNQEFMRKMESLFGSDSWYTIIDCIDRDNHTHDAILNANGYGYKFDFKVIRGIY